MNNTMPTEIELPKTEQIQLEAVIEKWLKNDGDTVKEDEPLVILETERGELTLNSTASGKLKIRAQEGETIRIGQVIAEII